MLQPDADARRTLVHERADDLSREFLRSQPGPSRTPGDASRRLEEGLGRLARASSNGARQAQPPCDEASDVGTVPTISL